MWCSSFLVLLVLLEGRCHGAKVFFNDSNRIRHLLQDLSTHLSSRSLQTAQDWCGSVEDIFDDDFHDDAPVECTCSFASEFVLFASCQHEGTLCLQDSDQLLGACFYLPSSSLLS
jgi:hypothetical protein